MSTSVRIGPSATDKLRTLVRRGTGRRTDWTAYARAYDMLADHNPAYRALIRGLDDFLGTIEPPRRILDIGAGTGNFTEVAARRFPHSEITVVEPDPGMMAVARTRLAGHGAVTFDENLLEDVRVEEPADLVICVHALYVMPGTEDRLREIRGFLRPGGHLYLVDIGRVLDLGDWRRFLFGALAREVGLAKAIVTFWRGREIARQNKAISRAQQEGRYWTHSGEDLARKVEAAGFEVIRQDSVYRGYSDLLVCRAVAEDGGEGRMNERQKGTP